MVSADYRIPQILNALGCFRFSPPLEMHIRSYKEIPAGSKWEVQLRGCSISCVETLRQLITREHPEAEVNAILIDFFLYDAMKEMEKNASDAAAQAEKEEYVSARKREKVLEVSEQPMRIIPHHRTRSIWY
jgi:hypothetical protein